MPGVSLLKFFSTGSFYRAGSLALRQTLENLKDQGYLVKVYSHMEMAFPRLSVSPSPLLSLAGLSVHEVRCEPVLTSLPPS
jgi:cytidylate kinase